MGSLKVLLVFLLVTWCYHCSCTKLRYIADFNNKEFNASVFHWEVTTRSGIIDTKNENTHKEEFRVEIMVYGTDSIFIHIQSLEAFQEDPKEIFQFILNNNESLFFQNNESDKKINIMKSFANLLLFDFDTLSQAKSDGELTYTVIQKTIYGCCSIGTTISSLKEGETTTVQQTFDPMECTNFSPTFFSNIDGVKEIRGLTINNYRKYNIIKRDLGGHFSDKMESNQKIIWSPARVGTNLTHFLEINHKITFMEGVNESLDDTDFDFHTYHEMEISSLNQDPFKDVRNIQILEPENKPNLETLLSDIKRSIVTLVNIWNGKRMQFINDKIFDYSLNQKIIETINLLKLASGEQLIQLWEELKKDNSQQGASILENYHQFSPLVGTEGAVSLVQYLISENKVKTEITDDMLSRLAGSIQFPTEKILKMLKELMYKSDSYAATFAYSATLGTALKNYPNSEEVKLLVDEAMREVIGIINDSLNDYEEVRRYLLILGNLRTISLENKGISTLRDKLSKTNQDLYMYLLIAFEKTTPDSFAFDLMVEILKDSEFNSELRAVALSIALEHIPSLEHFEALGELMKNEKNNEVYSLFESAIQAIINHQKPTDTGLEIFFRPPSSNSNSKSRVFFFLSPKEYPVRLSIQGYMFFNESNKALQTVSVDIDQFFQDKPVRLFSVFLRVKGLTGIDTTSHDVLKQTLLNNDKIDYEVTRYKGDRIVSSKKNSFEIEYYLYKIIKIVLEPLDPNFNFNPFKFEIGNQFQDWNLDYSFPTDSGKNAKIYFTSSCVITNALKFLFTSLTRRGMSEMSQYTIQNTFGMSSLNSDMEILQGTEELSNLHFGHKISFLVSTEHSSKTLNVESADAKFHLSSLYVPKKSHCEFSKKIGDGSIIVMDGRSDSLNNCTHN